MRTCKVRCGWALLPPLCRCSQLWRLSECGSISWGIVPSLNLDQDDNRLYSISGVASNDLWAVGQRGDGGTCCPLLPLIEHWDGISWSVVSNPGLAAGLFGVTALSATDAWAVDGSGLMQQQHWDGATWKVVPSTDPGTGSVLQGVTAVLSGDVWAVGWTNTNGAITPLIEHFTQV